MTTTTTETRWDWVARGACRVIDPEELFVDGAAQNRAKAIRAGCPVRTECLAYALDGRIPHGVWGGLFFGFGMSHETWSTTSVASSCAPRP
jgi:hypothetical protein